MKTETKGNPDLTPREERAILDQIRNDPDLIARLSITPQELEALSKCALLGTLTCKQDMLFILRQIREATSSTIDHTTLFPQPSAVNETENEDPVPELRNIATRLAPKVIPEPGSLDTVVRREPLSPRHRSFGAPMALKNGRRRSTIRAPRHHRRKSPRPRPRSW